MGSQSQDALAEADVLPDEDDEDEEFFVGGRRQSYRLRELDVARWQADLQQDKATLEAVRQQVAAITPERDGKLREIKQAVRDKAANPMLDREDNLNRKLLVFTSFKDTAQYLYDNLADLVEKLGISMAMVSGDETHTTTGANNFNAILTNFAPRARNRGSADTDADIDLLIATDCISEGQNHRTATPCSTTTSTGTRCVSSNGSGASTASAAGTTPCACSTTGPLPTWTCT